MLTRSSNTARFAVIITLTFVVGCNITVPTRYRDPVVATEKRPEQDRAIRTIWIEVFGFSEQELALVPDITWENGYYLMERPNRPEPALKEQNRAGAYYEMGDWIRLVYQDKDGRVLPFSKTVLAHELMHARQRLLHSIADPNHERSEDWSLVDQANQRLAQEGL